MYPIFCRNYHKKPWLRYFPINLYDEGCMSEHLFDPWTLTHISYGIFQYFIVKLYLLKYDKDTFELNFIINLVITVIFEITESSPIILNTFRKTGYPEYGGDSLVNLIGDIIGNMSGVYLAHIMYEKIHPIYLLLLVDLLFYTTFGLSAILATLNFFSFNFPNVVLSNKKEQYEDLNKGSIVYNMFQNNPKYFALSYPFHNCPQRFILNYAKNKNIN